MVSRTASSSVGGVRAVLARHIPQRIAAFAALVRDVDAVDRAAARARARRLRRSCSSGPARTRDRPTGRPRPPAAPAHERAHPRDLLLAVAGRCTSSPITRRRTVPCPTSSIAFRPMPFFSSSARCSADRPRRTAVLVDDHGGDALRDEVRRRPAGRIRIAESAARARSIVGVRVDVDEARRDVLAGGVDGRLRRASPSRPTATMRPSLTAMSAGNHGLPVPSMTRPLRISRS